MWVLEEGGVMSKSQTLAFLKELEMASRELLHLMEQRNHWLEEEEEKGDEN